MAPQCWGTGFNQVGAESTTANCGKSLVRILPNSQLGCRSGQRWND